MEQSNQPNRVKEFFTSTLGRITITAVSALIIYGILVIALQSNSQVVLFITLAVCAIFGWKALNRITPNIFIIGTTNFWLGYFLIKGLLSMLIGALIAPFQIGKMISDKLSETMVE